MTDIRIDKKLARQAFARAAAHYDEAAVLQREIGDRMLERLDYIHHPAQVILEVGAGTGHCSRQLYRKFPHAQIYALDIAEPMLRQARQHQGLRARFSRRMQYLCGDAERLPLSNASVDMIFSNLTLQWVNDLAHTLNEFARVLRPGGMLLFSTFGPATLQELHQAWQAVDDYSHVNRFVDLHDIGDLLLQARLAEPVMDAEHLTLTYSDVYQLMRDLKAIGAHNVTSARSRGLMGKQKLQRFIQAYEQFRRDGRLPATYEVIYGHAWGTQKQPRSVSVNEIPLSEIGKVPRV